MKLLVGLGNPGDKYTNTLHNIGFKVTDTFAQKNEATWQNFSADSKIIKLSNFDAILLQPQTFMNESGKSVAEICTFYKISAADIWVIHDDLDLVAGDIKISFDSSSAGHKGVQSIIDTLSTQAFWRFRLGIGRPTDNITPESYVLKSPDSATANKISEGIIKVSDLLQLALEKDITSARSAIKQK